MSLSTDSSCLNTDVTRKNTSSKKTQSISDFIVAFNTSLLAAGFFGLLSPATSALLHNLSTMGICAKSMTTLNH